MFGREIWFSLKVFGASCSVVRGLINVSLRSKVSLCRKMSCVTIPELQHPHYEANGQIQVIFGPMFSGKTTELMRRIKRYQVANHSCLVIKYIKDDRYDAEGVSTHDQQKLKATACSKLYSVKDKALNHTVIGVDEGQFLFEFVNHLYDYRPNWTPLSPDVVEFCEEMASRGKIVVVAALDGTYQRKPFGPILNLVPLAESVVKLSAVCMNCFNDASFTKRLGQEKQVEIIGGADKYMAVCRGCYHLSPVKEILAGSSIRRHNHFY